MADTKDIPVELREFNAIFNKLCYRYDDYQVFRDFISLTICIFSDGKLQKEHEEIWNRYNEKERPIFSDLFTEMAKTLERIFKDENVDWYDIFGHYYEILASSSKRSSFGQFFTPKAVCDLMTDINTADIPKPVMGKTINDPSCGSGRTLLSFNAKNPGNILWGDDLDELCCKMTVLNFILHGANGVVRHMNTLSYEKYKGWVIVAPFKVIPMDSKELAHYEYGVREAKKTIQNIENIFAFIQDASENKIDLEEKEVIEQVVEATTSPEIINIPGTQLTIF